MALTGDSTILVPVDVSATDPLDRAILDLLRPVDVVVLGYYPVPTQTAPAHLKADHESEAASRLDAVVAEFEQTEHEVESVLVFTKDRRDTIDRIADQHDCDAVLFPREAGPVERIFVPLRGDVNLERIVSLVADLVRASDAAVTLFHSVDDGVDPSQGEFVLRGAADRLSEEGVERDRIDWTLAEGAHVRDAILDAAADFDLVIVGETDPSLRDRIIGTRLSPILDELTQSAMVVRDLE